MDFNIDMQMVETFLMEEGLDWGMNIAAALAIFFFGRIVAKMVTGFAKRVMGRAKMDETLVSFLGNVVYSILLAFVIIASINKLGVETTSLAAIIAAAGLAIGLALQGSLSNLAAGVMLIAFRPFKKGDFVEAAGTSGTVNDLSIFTTTLKTPDNKVIIVPNSAVLNGNITNFSAMDTRRVDMVFGVGYSDDLKKVKEVLNDIISKDDRILKDPEPTIAVSELADSSVNLVVRPWVKSADYWAVFFDTTETVKLRFDKEGISIPFPQQDVHMHQAETAPKKKAA